MMEDKHNYKDLEKQPLLAEGHVSINKFEDTTTKNTEQKAGKFLFWEMNHSSAKEVQVLFLMLLVIATGSANNVARKIMTQPMGHYSFFVSLFNSFAYVLLYNSIFIGRVALGAIPKEMAVYPWKRNTDVKSVDKSIFVRFWNAIPPVKYFIMIGFLEGLGTILGIIATPQLTGPMISLMGQSTVFFSMIVSVILLGARYTVWQVLSVIFVVAGAVVSVLPNILGNADAVDVNIFYVIIMSLASLPNSLSFALKELVFKDKKNLDIFVVNSTGAIFQLLWWPIMIPITVILHQTAGLPLPTYIEYGFQCFAGQQPDDHMKEDCSPNPFPYAIYICINLTFNIFLLLLLKKASALQGFMAMNGILPAGVLLFYFSWPLIGSCKINMYIIISLVVVMLGLGLYRWTTVLKERNAKIKA